MMLITVALTLLIGLSPTVLTDEDATEDIEVTLLDEDQMEKRLQTWTDCDEFLGTANEFDIMKVVDIDWKIFYFWTPDLLSSYIMRFQVPSPTLIYRMREELQSVQPSVNWEAAELFLETSVDFSALFIRFNTTPGLYRLVSPQVTYGYQIPSMFGFKLVEPGYLGMMNCYRREVYALAPADRMPADDEVPIDIVIGRQRWYKIETAAAQFEVKNDYHVSYLKMENETKKTAYSPIIEHEHIRDNDRDYDPMTEDLGTALF